MNYSYTDEHNARRVLHCGTAALTRDESLERAAQQYADSCPTEHASRIERGGAGENMYWRGGKVEVGTSADNLARAVESWYAEVAHYDFATGKAREGAGAASAVVGHFTQLVWRETTRVGCGVNLHCANKFNGSGFANSVVVCRYMTPGNYRGEHLANVAELIVSASGGGGRGGGRGGCASGQQATIGAEAAEDTAGWERLRVAAALRAAASLERGLLPPGASGPSP